ncbi:MAG: hypothetical protein KGM47_06405, partial [Acidobacteriota bacterium]|nr:hypothetical protein [Acidobacteriota bacterium]
GGLPEIVLEGETGWLVEAGEPAAMAEKIVDAACQERRTALSRGARKRAELFTNDIMTLKVERLYRRLAGNESGGMAAHEAGKTIRS